MTEKIAMLGVLLLLMGLAGLATLAFMGDKLVSMLGERTAELGEGLKDSAGLIQLLAIAGIAIIVTILAARWYMQRQPGEKVQRYVK